MVEAVYQNNPKNDSETQFYRLMNSYVFRKAMENATNHKEIKLLRTDRITIQLVLDSNYRIKICFSEHLLVVEINKTENKIKTPVYLFLLNLYITKIAIYYECWHDYAKIMGTM